MNKTSVSIEITIKSNGEKFSAFCCKTSADLYTICYPNNGEGFSSKEISEELLEFMYKTESIQTDNIDFAYNLMTERIKRIWGDVDIDLSN